MINKDKDNNKSNEIIIVDNNLKKEKNLPNEIINKNSTDINKENKINNNIALNVNNDNKNNEKEDKIREKDETEDKLSIDNFKSFQIDKVKEFKSFTIPKDDNFNRIDSIFMLKNNKVLLYIERDKFEKFYIYDEKKNDIYSINLSKNLKRKDIHNILRVEESKIILLLNKEIFLVDINKNEIIKYINFWI